MSEIPGFREVRPGKYVAIGGITDELWKTIDLLQKKLEIALKALEYIDQFGDDEVIHGALEKIRELDEESTNPQ